MRFAIAPYALMPSDWLVAFAPEYRVPHIRRPTRRANAADLTIVIQDIIPSTPSLTAARF
jgi:hypothetical protein